MTPDQLEKQLNAPLSSSLRPINHSNYEKWETLEKLAPMFIDLWKAAEKYNFRDDSLTQSYRWLPVKKALQNLGETK